MRYGDMETEPLDGGVLVTCSICGTQGIAGSESGLQQGRGVSHGKACSARIGRYEQDRGNVEHWKRFRDVFGTILQRTGNPTNTQYGDYGGRGIAVEWPDVQAFYYDMFPSYLEGLAEHGKVSIDRVDNDGNYSKSNCRWATCTQQSNNQRRRKDSLGGVELIDPDGVSYTFESAHAAGVYLEDHRLAKIHTIYGWIRKGTQPTKRSNMYGWTVTATKPEENK